MRKKFASACALTVLATGFTPQSAMAASGAAGSGAGYAVSGYDVSVAYEPKTEVLTGDTTVKLTTKKPLDELTLNLALPAVAVEINGKAARSFSASDGKLRVTPAQRIGTGKNVKVRIRYAGQPGKDNPAWARTEDGGAVTVTDTASSWFPTSTDKSARAQLNVTATVPANWVAISNGLELPAEDRAGRNSFRWRTAAPLRPANATLGVGPWKLERSRLDDGTPVVNAFGKGAEDRAKPAADQLPSMMKHLTESYGAYPFDSVGGIFVDPVDRNTPYYAGQGRAVISGTSTDGFDPSILVHELAHSWFGNSVAPATNDDAAISEGLASYAPWQWAEASGGTDLDTRYRNEIKTLADDADWWRQTIVPSSMGMYTKAPYALHALRKSIGDTDFDRLLKEWTTRYANSHRTWTEFEQLAAEVAGKNLTGFFDAWARGTTIPHDAYLWPAGMKN
ncbi:M1 family aminopeptidase [Streptomyces sp. NPDC101490]|uniref:M1 family aminopeptidase n=1 Tax=Streptomyces sp. NPDC101490 TaxID=3366143 RepID=UPI00382815F4